MRDEDGRQGEENGAWGNEEEFRNVKLKKN